MRTAALALATSCAVLLAATGSLWWLTHDEPARADLVDPSPAAETTTLPTTTTAPVGSTPTTTTTTIRPPATEPRRLRIPELGIDSTVVPVALEDDGSMQVPAAGEAGWYRPGVVPGSPTGSAVIAAHVDFGGRRGVFFELRRLSLGSEVAVVDDTGTEHRFRVVERSQVDKDALPIPELFRPTGAPTLTLITCGGAFDRGARSYADNIVVRAVPV